MASDPPRGAGLPPGYDEEDPYDGEDLSTYPEWWRRNVEEFRAFGMRPYRPPRLADGTLTPPLVAELEDEYGVDVRFQSRDPEADKWELVVDGEVVRRVEHERDGSGYTVYGIEREGLRAAIEEAVYRST
jgi:hypothetical protein